MRTLDRRLRRLEDRAPNVGGDCLHVGFVRRGMTMEDARAKLIAEGYREGDHVIYVRFVRPGDVTSPETQH